MKNLEQIKNEYAVSKGYITIIDIINECIIEHDHERILKLINDISIESQKGCLLNSSDKIDTSCFKSQSDYVYTFKEVTNENNIIK